MDIIKSLNENAGHLEIPISIRFINETAKMDITEQVLDDMFKFVSDKYTSLDFSEIEKSAGDITKFKYKSLIAENASTLFNIYNNGNNETLAGYAADIDFIINRLHEASDDISYLYGKDNGMIQMFYISTLASIIYGMSALITLTIQFATDNTNGDIDVMFEDLPNPTRYVHLKNITKAANILRDDSFNVMIKKTIAAYRKPVTESAFLPTTITLAGSISTPVLAFAAVPILLYMATKIVPFIREVIYSVYYSRVKYSTAIDVQINLLKTNIESLENRKGSKKIIATQKKYVDNLEKLRDTITIKNDKATIDTNAAIRSDDKKIVISVTNKNKDAGVTSTQVSNVINNSNDLLI